MPYITNHPKYIAYFEAIEKQKQLEISQAQTVKAGDVVELEFVKMGTMPMTIIRNVGRKLI